MIIMYVYLFKRHHILAETDEKNLLHFSVTKYSKILSKKLLEQGYMYFKERLDSSALK